MHLGALHHPHNLPTTRTTYNTVAAAPRGYRTIIIVHVFCRSA